MLILAGVSLNVALDENGPIKSAIKANLYQKYSTYLEEFENSAIYSDDDIFASDDNMKKYISSISNEDIEKFMIIDGDLYYCGSIDKEKNVAENLGINISLAGAQSSNDIKNIVKYLGDIQSNTRGRAD